MDTTEFEAAGLYDPASAAASQRWALLEWLHSEGFSIAEMVAADQEGRLGALPVDRIVAPAFQGLTLQEVTGRTGLSPDLAERAQRALGLPPIDGPNYSEVALGAFAAAVAFFGTDPALQFTRVLGSSIARAIEAAVSLFVSEMTADQVSELELSRGSYEAARLLLTLPETIDALFPMFVADAVHRVRLGEALATGGTRVAVGFVDLVGSTRLSQQLSGRELAEAVGEFETMAYDLAITHDGRIVKFIGDAAMFVTSEPAAACSIGIELCLAVAAHPVLQGARGAIGFGDAIAQSGDFYGPMVNLVSRLTGIADDGQLLATTDVAATVEPRSNFEFRQAGAHMLRGFPEPVQAFSVHQSAG